MGVKISNLPAIPSCALTDLIAEVQPAAGGTTYKATLSQVNTLLAANLVTPANGGIVYTDANSLELLAPTATANKVLMSGASSAPHWSTPTYPTASGTAGKILRSDGTNIDYTTSTFADTYSASSLLYSNGANTVTGLATGNDGVLITSAGGVPSISSTLPQAVQDNITRLGAQAEALNMNSNLISNVTDPSSAQDAATKAYVDAVATGLKIQASCVCASTTAYTVTYANGASGVGATLTNAGALAAFSADGVSPTVGQRVLIKDQASTLQNGIYTVTTAGSGAVAWVLTRATDFDTPGEIQPGDLVPIQTGGTTLGGTSWMQTATVTTVGVDAITFIQFSASIPVNVSSGGTGLTSATAYAVLCGGTTATGAFQSIASVGTATHVLTSNGAGALPTFQAIPAASTATNLFNTTACTVTDTTGRITYPAQPAFSAYLSAAALNVTGDGTNYTIIFDTEIKDIGSNYNNATGVFTAPVTGMYAFSINISMAQMSAANDVFQVYLATTTGDHRLVLLNPTGLLWTGSILYWGGSIIVQMTSGNTASVHVVAGGSTLTSDVSSGIGVTQFSGWMLG